MLPKEGKNGFNINRKPSIEIAKLETVLQLNVKKKATRKTTST